MSLNNKGIVYYELLICIFILFTLCFLINLNINISKSRLNNKLTYSMQQMLINNLLLYEKDEELIYNENYDIIIKDQNICIRWADLYAKECELCIEYSKK